MLISYRNRKEIFMKEHELSKAILKDIKNNS